MMEYVRIHSYWIYPIILNILLVIAIIIVCNSPYYLTSSIVLWFIIIACFYSCSWLNDINIYNTTSFDIEKIPLDSIANTKRWPLYLKLYHNADLQDAREVCRLFDELGIDYTQNVDLPY